jgi:hypothetical protein
MIRSYLERRYPHHGYGRPGGNTYASALPCCTRCCGQPGRIDAAPALHDDRTEFTIITIWDGLESFIAFAGPGRPGPRWREVRERQDSPDDPANREGISRPRDQAAMRPVGMPVSGSLRVRPGCRRGAWTGSGMQGGPVDELLDAAVERPALDQLEVEVGRAREDRVGPGLGGDDRGLVTPAGYPEPGGWLRGGRVPRRTPGWLRHPRRPRPW